MTTELLAAVATYGLAGSVGLDGQQLPDDQLDELVRAAATHRLIGLLAAAVGDGALATTAAQFDVIADEHERWCGHVLQAECLLLALGAELARAGHTYRLFKGSALAHLVYDDPAYRPYADLDLMVPGEELDDIRELIVREFDGNEALPELRPGFDREFGKESLVRVGSIEVDLHRTFVTGGFGLTVPLRELFAGTDTVEIGSTNVPVLAPHPTVMQTAYNAALGDWPLRYASLRDFAGAIEHWQPPVADIARTARRWRATAVVARAVELTWSELGLASNELCEWAASVEAPLRERLLLRTYLTSARSYTRPAGSLLVIPGIRPRLRYAAAIVRPQPSYLEARSWSQRGHFARAWSRLRR